MAVVCVLHIHPHTRHCYPILGYFSNFARFFKSAHLCVWYPINSLCAFNCFFLQTSKSFLIGILSLEGRKMIQMDMFKFYIIP
jgi:hypothetical protein